MQKWIVMAALLLSAAGFVSAQEEDPVPLANSQTQAQTNRDPAQDSIPGHVANEDELKVQAQLPEAAVKHDARSFQSDVYKTLFNKDLKPDQREDALDE